MPLKILRERHSHYQSIMKRINISLAVVGILVVAALGVGAIVAGDNSKVACTGHVAGAETHSVMIMDNKAYPQTTKAKLCDTLTITNMDNKTRIVAFGPHEDHVPYDGVTEKILHVGDAFTVTLNQAGSFHFHDHLNDDADGYFNVTK